VRFIVPPFEMVDVVVRRALQAVRLADAVGEPFVVGVHHQVEVARGRTSCPLSSFVFVRMSERI
jgi:hypothetical protein